MSARNGFRRIAVSNGLKTTNFVANPALATSYNLTLPSTVPTLPGQSLISDTSGNLSWGSAVATISTFTGTTNPLTTPANVTGLLLTATSSSISVYAAINASTNIYALYTLKVYQKGSSSSWGLAYEVDCDTDDTDPYVLFTITSTGQIQYTIPTTFAGFTSLVLMWTLGTSVSNNLTSLALSSNFSVGGSSTFTAPIQGTSLALSSTLNVTGLATLGPMTGISLGLGTSSISGTPSSTLGPFLNVQPQTYLDSGTAASTTAAGTFSASYLGIPTLAATNTGVTTGTASTLTIAGPPVAGTNETITNAYALNVSSGNANFGGTVTVGGNFALSNSMRYSGRWNLNTATSITSGNAALIASAASQWTLTPGFVTNNASLMLNSSGGITFPVKGSYTVGFTVAQSSVTSLTDFEAYFMIAFKAGGYSDRLAWVKYPYSSGNTCSIAASENVDVSTGDMLCIYVYQASGGTITLNIDANGNGSSSLTSNASATSMSCRLNQQII